MKFLGVKSICIKQGDEAFYEVEIFKNGNKITSGEAHAYADLLDVQRRNDDANKLRAMLNRREKVEWEKTRLWD